MTTNDPYGSPADAPEPDEQAYTPPPVTQAPQQWPAPVQYYAGSAPYAPGTYGQSYRSDETYQAGQPGRYGQPSYDGSSYDGSSYGQSSYGQSSYDGSSYGQSSYGQSSYGQFGPAYPSYGYGQAPGGAPAGPKRSRRLLAGLCAAVVAAAVVLVGVGFVVGSNSSSTSGSGTALQPQLQTPTDGTGGSSAPSNGSGNTGNGGALPNGGSSTGSNPTATATQQIGIVTIVSVLKYQSAESAGTGMVLTSDGEVLTNNHVVNGATSVTVTVESTGKSYKADVVGTAPTKDVAVLKLRDASGLKTAQLSTSAQDVQVGDAVTGVGNAGGTGTLTAAGGKVTGLDKTITATDESGAEAERLTGLIQVDAPIISGDSGGPLYNADGEVVGIDTAASTDQQTGAASIAYAIRIDNALGVAKQIDAGVRTTTIHIGLPAFVGFSLQDQNGAVVVPPATGGQNTVFPGSPAAEAGIEPGSTITSVAGTKVTSAAGIKSVLAAKRPGDRVKIGWTDANGGTHSATLTLTTGPAD